MKFTLSIVLFIICAMQARAQSFSTATSKEETISYINSTLQNSLKEEYNKVTFTGNELILTPKDGRRKTEYKITDWADCEDIHFNQSENDLWLKYKKNSITIKSYDKTTGELLDTYDENFIILSGSMSKEKNENLVAAFKHLSRIYIESKFPGKPSFEETVKYINVYLSQIKRVEGDGRFGNIRNIYSYENIEAQVTQSKFDINDFDLSVYFTNMEEKQK